MAGTIFVDYAGTLADAKLFAAEHGFNVPARAPAGGEGPVLSLPFKDQAGFENGVQKFVPLGWDRESLMVRFRPVKNRQ